MGAVVSALVPVAASVIAGLVSVFSHRRAAPNPVIQAIHDENARRELEEAVRCAEGDAEASRNAQAEYQRLAADLERMTEEATAAQRRAEEDTRRVRDEYAQREREDATRRSQENADRTARDDAFRRAQEEIDLKARKCAADANNARMAQVKADGQADAARRKVAEAEQAIREAQETKEEARKTVDNAEKTINEERAARERLEENLRMGLAPVELPTKRQISDAKHSYQYAEGIFHFAVAGIAGSGKSSLINAFCGYPNNHPNAAKTGIVETTSQVTRYPDPNPKFPFAWYDVPGAGTLNVPDWQYFNDQGLYVFDCIIVLFDTRFTSTDVAILRSCRRYNIPSYIVRSKANQHIKNIIADMEDHAADEDEDYDDARRRQAELYPQAREAFIEKTRQNVAANLQTAALPEQRVYIVSNMAMLTIIKGKVPRNFIDEYDLLRDILEEAKRRRL